MPYSVATQCTWPRVVTTPAPALSCETMRETFPHVYLLAPESVYNVDGRLESVFDMDNRQVCILYGSKTPLDLGGMKAAHDKLALRDPLTGNKELMGFHTNVMPTATFDDYMKNLVYCRGADRTSVRWKPPVLTDQFAPVDTLMSAIFRARKER